MIARVGKTLDCGRGGQEKGRGLRMGSGLWYKERDTAGALCLPSRKATCLQQQRQEVGAGVHAAGRKKNAHGTPTTAEDSG